MSSELYFSYKERGLCGLAHHAVLVQDPEKSAHALLMRLDDLVVCHVQVQKEENLCPRFVWHRQWWLAAGKSERMWCFLQALLPGEEHMLATNRTCGRRGPVLVLDMDFGGAAHGTIGWLMKEGVSLEGMHMRRKDMKEYRKSGLHHAEFYRDQGSLSWVYTSG